MENIIEALLDKEIHVIDFLPRQVPAESRGQFFEVEKFFLRGKLYEEIFSKFLKLLLKLNCYYDFTVRFEGEITKNPEPNLLGAFVKKSIGKMKNQAVIVLNDGEAMIVLDGGSLNLSVYNADEKLQKLLGALSSSEGLFFRKA